MLGEAERHDYPFTSVSSTVGAAAPEPEVPPTGWAGAAAGGDKDDYQEESRQSRKQVSDL